MEATQIIQAFPDINRPVPVLRPFLNVAEFFCDSIQGENFVGVPSAFLRLQGCTCKCTWCDTTEVWHQGNPYTFLELFNLMDNVDLPRKLFEGQHLIITGGSPLLQQTHLIEFIKEFINLYEFKPFVEIENECTIMPEEELIKYIDLWNNSPKLENSGVSVKNRYKPEILLTLTTLKNSWFKFVISKKEDWDEIYKFFIQPGYVQKQQIVLMPEGATREELEKHRELVLKIAIENNVRYTDRLHVLYWGKKIGI
jgi:7-carboxy-7-deazaguanine synthase